MQPLITLNLQWIHLHWKATLLHRLRIILLGMAYKVIQLINMQTTRRLFLLLYHLLPKVVSKSMRRQPNYYSL